MASLKAKKTESSLLKKGFLWASGDHNYLELWHDGKYVLQTFLSHNNQDIGDDLISKMRKQCQLDKKEFMDLINCPLSQEAYIKLLKVKGIVDVDGIEQEVESKGTLRKVSKK